MIKAIQTTCGNVWHEGESIQQKNMTDEEVFLNRTRRVREQTTKRKISIT